MIESKAIADLFSRAWAALRGVFRRGVETRADVIGATEASFAVNSGALDAVDQATARRKTKPKKAWRVDGRPCPICISNRDAGLIPLGEPFPSGDGWPPQHPGCFCAVAVEDVED